MKSNKTKERAKKSSKSKSKAPPESNSPNTLNASSPP
jgi:hypothetical protein